MCINFIQGLVLLQKADSRLLTNPWHTGDVIRCVTYQGFIIHHLVGVHTEVCLNVLRGIVLGFRDFCP
ncbi:MAG: hypothetical protein ACD_34C00649G0002 [uncultured bacterium]|nr:MAG: hypothetical protein ACD_34C00649G0002 [uncultured bacterium]